MWHSKRIILIITLSLLAIAVFPWMFGAVRQALVERNATACDISNGTESEKLDCWLQLIFSEMKRGGVASAFAAFGHIYDTYPMFGASGCHQHAHKVGDTAYYEFFVAKGLTLEEMDFPQETTTCGYGFFHGFVEHLIQDNPDPAFVAETCEYLRSRLSHDMRDIGTICYHASGHGFTVAKADVLKKSEWGNMRAMIEMPLARCEGLPTNEKEVEDCREGVFNVISDWMTMNNLGLEFNFEDPFSSCNQLPARWHYACYYEFGMKLEPVTGDSPIRAAEYVQSIRDFTLREMTFGVMVAGMMQRDAPLGSYLETFKECTSMPDELFKMCITSSANGMMEHGSPGKEYMDVMRACAEPILSPREGTRLCFETLALRLSRFYTQEEKARICEEFPQLYKDSCHRAS